MAQRTFTVTLDFDDETLPDEMDRVSKDLQSGLYETLREGKRSGYRPGYETLTNMGVK